VYRLVGSGLIPAVAGAVRGIALVVVLPVLIRALRGSG
jgi:hypothetical protein